MSSSDTPDHLALNVDPPQKFGHELLFAVVLTTLTHTKLEDITTTPICIQRVSMPGARLMTADDISFSLRAQ
jgi:hypothetical protein